MEGPKIQNNSENVLDNSENVLAERRSILSLLSELKEGKYASLGAAVIASQLAACSGTLERAHTPEGTRAHLQAVEQLDRQGYPVSVIEELCILEPSDSYPAPLFIRQLHNIPGYETLRDAMEQSPHRDAITQHIIPSQKAIAEIIREMTNASETRITVYHEGKDDEAIKADYQFREYFLRLRSKLFSLPNTPEGIAELQLEWDIFFNNPGISFSEVSPISIGTVQLFKERVATAEALKLSQTEQASLEDIQLGIYLTERHLYESGSIISDPTYNITPEDLWLYTHGGVAKEFLLHDGNYDMGPGGSSELIEASSKAYQDEQAAYQKYLEERTLSSWMKFTRIAQEAAASDDARDKWVMDYIQQQDSSATLPVIVYGAGHTMPGAITCTPRINYNIE